MEKNWSCKIDFPKGEISYYDENNNLKTENIKGKKLLQLLEYIVINHDRFLTNDQIYAAVWGDVGCTDDNLKSYVSRLRSYPPLAACIPDKPKNGYYQFCLPDTFLLVYEAQLVQENKDVNVQNAAFWNNKSRIEESPETEIPSYIDELVRIYERDKVLASEILCGDLFQWLLCEYTELLYRSGLFFRLAQCGLDLILEKQVREEMKKSPNAPMDSQSTKLAAVTGLFFYSTKKYSTAIPFISWSLQNEDELSLAVRNELRNLHALCYLKNMQYDLAKEQYEKLLEDGTSADKADACIHLGRIMCVADGKEWEEIRALLDEAIKHVENEISDGVVFNLNQLKERKAEYCRIAAMLGLWMQKYEYSEEMLKKAGSIYTEVCCEKRYWARFRASQIALEIVKADTLDDGNFKRIDEALKEAQEKASVLKEYEENQLLFWRAIATYKHGEKNEARRHLVEAYKKARKIDSWLEATEAAVLLQSIWGTTHLESTVTETSQKADKETMRNWAAHVVQVLNLKPHNTGE